MQDVGDQLAEARGRLEEIRDARIAAIDRVAQANAEMLQAITARVAAMDAKLCLGGSGIALALTALELVVQVWHR
jgi:hypothetical protein